MGADVRYNEVLTQFSVAFMPPNLVWNRIFKPMQVIEDSNVYPVFDKDLFTLPNDLRSKGTPSNEVTLGWRYEPYLCKKHGLRGYITDEDKRNVNAVIELEFLKTRLTKQAVWNNMETAIFGSSGILRTAGNNVGSANKDWTNPATATIGKDLSDGKEAVGAACGQEPNTIVLSVDTARYIMQTADYLDRTKYTGQQVDQDLPAKLYGLDAVYVGGLVSSAKKGQAKSLARIMGDDVWVGYVNPSESLGPEELTYGACIQTKEYTRSWFDDDREEDVVEYNFIYDLKLVAKECGYLFTSVRTA